MWLCCCGALAFFAGIASAAEKWPDINKAELAETKPKIDPEAGAEILLRDVVLDYSSIGGGEERHYIRAKIFSERGIKYFSLVKIPYGADGRIMAIAARTIKPDGTILEVKPEDIHSRDEVTDGESRTKSKTFAFPGLEVGAIIEYKYTKTTTFIIIGAPLIFQGDLPSRVVRFKVMVFKMPAEMHAAYDLRAVSFNCPTQKLDPKDGVLKFELTDLPAFKHEPYGPPMLATHAALVLFYTRAKDLPTAEFWHQESKEMHKKYNPLTKTTPQISAALAEIVAPADSEDQKLRKIYDWCRTKITNRDRNTTHLTSEGRKAIKLDDATTATDILQAKSGNGRDINLLFVALARAAGLDARIAACNNRTQMLFNEKITEPRFMLFDTVAAVRLGAQWRYFDPGASYLPFGALRSRNTDTAILVSDSKGLEEPTIVAAEPAEANLVERKANFTLSAAGTLEGDVTETFSGLEEMNFKSSYDDKTPEKRTEFVRARIKKYMKQARVTNIVVENADNPLAPPKVSYHLHVPAYAEKTDSRLFFQPAVYQKSGRTRLMLEDTERKTSLIFPHRFMEKDEVNITLPSGYSLEAGSAPAGVNDQRIGQYEVNIIFNQVTHVLTYRRELSLTSIKFSKAAYPTVKACLDQVRQQDGHTLTLKRNENTEDSTTPPEVKEPEEETDSKEPMPTETKSKAETDEYN